MLYLFGSYSIIRILGCPIDMQDDKHQKAYRGRTGDYKVRYGRKPGRVIPLRESGVS